MGLFGGGNSRTYDTDNNYDQRQDNSQTINLSDEAQNIGGHQATAGGIVSNGPVSVTDGGAILSNQIVSQDAIRASEGIVEDITQASVLAHHENTVLAGLSIAANADLAAQVASQARADQIASTEIATNALTIAEKAAGKATAVASRALDSADAFANEAGSLARDSLAASTENTNSVLDLLGQIFQTNTDQVNQQNAFVSQITESAFEATRADSTINFETLIKWGAGAAVLVYGIRAFAK